jgi:1,5-anhydro-D-fructose reductase (1,5-anhydro-D-mannitol-forming)
MALGWAIISTGLHVDHKIAPAISATPDAALVAICSRDQGRADACAQKHGARAAYSDLGALLRDSRVDAVFIASPNALHAPQALQVAQAGKHVFSEKPMATTLDDAVAMVRTCRTRGVKLGVGYHLRQHPGLREARRLIAQGMFGTVALAQGQWGFGVRGQDGPPPRTGLRQWWDDPALIGHASTMMGTGVHVVDALRFVLDQEVIEVAAISDGQTSARPLEQLLAMVLRFDRGTIATLCCGRRLPDSRNDLVVYGSLGRLIGSDALWEGRQGTFEVVSETVHTTDTYPPQPLANFIDELDDFHRAIREDRQPAATGLDGLRVVQVTLAMIASACEQRTVRIEPLTV